MAAAILPEPMMLMVVTMNVPPWCAGEVPTVRDAFDC